MGRLDLLLALALLWLAAPAAASPIADWMVMDVCVGPDGAVLAGVAPVDAACKARRKLAAGEPAPYQLGEWNGRGGASCGPIRKVNGPVIRDGVERIVSTSSRGAACPGNEEPHNSVQWHDASWGFIMGSWSQVAPSFFMAASCGAATGAARFFDGWIIGPAQVPAAGASGYTLAGGHVTHAAQDGAACSRRAHVGFTWWTVADVAFGGATLTALVSNHYAQAARDGQGPGGAMQMERTYWTQEFGLTRWEKWARTDWRHPRSGRDAEDLAAELRRSGRCTPPWNGALAVAPGLSVSPSPEAPAWREAVVAGAGEPRDWVMTLCADYTDLVREPYSAPILAQPAEMWAR